MKITQAVIPAAGLGTRFLPYTKVVPKELLPLLGKPAIQLIAEEGIACGITDFHLILNKNKQAIVDLFSPQPALEQTLQDAGKLSLLSSINAVIHAAHFNYIPQPEALGLGHAVLMAKEAIGNEYFGIFLPDEIMIGTVPALAQLIEIAKKYNASVIAVQEVPKNSVSSYGIIEIKEKLEDNLFEISRLVEKPAIDQAPSQFAIIGRYVLSPRIFDSLEKTGPRSGGEIQLTDGIAHMMQHGERVLACVVKSVRHDIGNPLGWLQANIYLGLLDPTYSPEITSYIKNLIAHK